MVSAAVAQCRVALEAMLLEPVVEPLCKDCDAAGQYEAGEFALEIAKRLPVRL
jgi:hypothetical protein